MNYTKRTLVVLAGLLVLAASSQAQVVLANPTSPTGDTITFGPNEADINPVNLSGIAFSTTLDTGSFTAQSATGISEIDVTDVTAGVGDGVLTLTVFDGATILYSDSTNTDNPLKEMQLNPVSIGTGVQTITYVASFVGSQPDSIAYLGAFSVVFTPTGSAPPPPVPEPASFGVMGIGVVGLALRNRRRVK